MIEVKNQFANHAIFWWVGLPLIAMFVLPLLIPPESFVITAEEVEFFKNMGIETSSATNSANDWFKTLFVDTKVRELFQSTFINSNMPMSSELQKSSRSFTSNWNDGFWNMFFRAIWRLHALWPVYLGGCISFVIPAFIDGLTVRAKKKYNFQVHNPVFFYASTHFAVLVLGLAVFLPFLPITLNALHIGGFFCVLALSMWIVASNFQSGV